MSDLHEFVLPDGTVRRLGNNPPPWGEPPRYSWPVYGEVAETPMVPRSQWAELIAALPEGPDHPNLPYVHDQDGIGQCNADATVALAEFQRGRQGLPFVKLSAADLYDRINGGVDRGSLLEDALREMMANGVGTAATCGTLWSRGMAKATAAERGRYKGLEAYICPTFAHVMSASLYGLGVVSGIMWYGNYTPDADGWLPEYGSGGGGGHAVFGYKPAMRLGRNGTVQYGIWHQNSWQERFGLRGRCVFPERFYNGPVGGWWALRSITDEGGVVPQEQ